MSAPLAKLQTSVLRTRLDKKVNETVQITSQKATLDRVLTEAVLVMEKSHRGGGQPRNKCLWHLLVGRAGLAPQKKVSITLKDCHQPGLRPPGWFHVRLEVKHAGVVLYLLQAVAFPPASFHL